MITEWTKAEKPYECYDGKTDSRFSAQIGRRNSVDEYAWMIFHQDFKFPVLGGKAGTLANAKLEAEQWLSSNVKPIR